MLHTNIGALLMLHTIVGAPQDRMEDKVRMVICWAVSRFSSCSALLNASNHHQRSTKWVWPDVGCCMALSGTCIAVPPARCNGKPCARAGVGSTVPRADEGLCAVTPVSAEPSVCSEDKQSAGL